MSTFKVEARRIAAIEPHTNANALEFAVIDGYRAIVRKDVYRQGQLIAYIPEGALTTRFLLSNLKLWDEANNKGLCAGEDGLRVKALTLRGALSQGLVYPLSHLEDHPLGAGWYYQDEGAALWPVREGDDLTALMGIRKYKPEIPADLDGLVLDGGIEVMPRFDIEDIKKYPDVLQDGETVVMTEKLHGTFSGYLLLPEQLAIPGHGDFLVFSKGLTEQALAFQDVPENADNVYLKAAHSLELRERLVQLRQQLRTQGTLVDEPLVMFGEIIGSASRQDLKYGSALALSVFDLAIGGRSNLSFFDRDEMVSLVESVGLRATPEIYRGPFSQEALARATTGRETYSGKSLHIREGVVVRPLKERRDPILGRVLLKSVSPSYLVRGGPATEYN